MSEPRQQEGRALSLLCLAGPAAEPQGRSRQHLPRRGSGHRGAGNRRASASGRDPDRQLVQGQTSSPLDINRQVVPGQTSPSLELSDRDLVALQVERIVLRSRHIDITLRGGTLGEGQGREDERSLASQSWSQARGDLKKAAPPGVTTRAARRGRDGRCRGRGRGRLHRPKGARYPACAPHEVVGRKFEHRRTGVNQATLPALAYAVRAPRLPWHGLGCLASKRRRRRWRRSPPGNPL